MESEDVSIKFSFLTIKIGICRPNCIKFKVGGVSSQAVVSSSGEVQPASMNILLIV